MERKPVIVDPQQFPETVRSFLTGADVYDSSCSPAARVWFIDREEGYYLKSAVCGSLFREASMTRFFHQAGLAAEVMHYEQTESDWMLTRRIAGEDCLDKQYRNNPQRLCDTLAMLLRRLHETDFTGCPVKDRTAEYIATAAENRRMKKWDDSLFPDNWGYRSADEAWAVVQEFSGALKTDTLIHGDYCLPNIILNNWNLSGFIDLGAAGIGDRHMDLFWGIWSLNYNLKTDAYGERFLDVYGKDGFDPEILRAIGAFEVFG